MGQITVDMQQAIKDSLAVTLFEMKGTEHQTLKEVRDWLDTVKNADDFFGQNTFARKEYDRMIQARESEYDKAYKKRKQSI